jgi:hypothetical protein
MAYPGFCPGFSECRVFSAGMKIILKIPFGNVFEGFLTRFLNYICIFKAFGVLAF